MPDLPGDVRIDGKWYKIDIKTYRGKDIIDFAPRAATPGGSVVMSDLNLYQPLLMTDWKHGFGFHWYSDPMGYMRTEGHIDTRHSGRAMLNMKQFETDSLGSNNDVIGFASFAGSVYSFGYGGLRKTGGSYTSAWSTPTFSNIEPDAISTASGSNTDELTFPHTVTDLGQNRILVVRLSMRVNVTVNSVTFNGVALTQLSTLGTTPRAEIWYLKNPAVGKHDVVVTVSAAATIAASAASYLYVDQTTPFGTPATASGTGTAASVTVTGVANDLILDVLAKNNGYSDTLIVNPTQVLEALLSTGGSNVEQGGHSRELSTTTSTPMDWSWTNSRAWVQIGVALKPATQTVTGVINCALATADYLFYCPDNQRIRKISKTGVNSAAGLDANSKDYSWMIIHRGFIFAAVEGTNRVHYSDKEDLSDLEGTASDPNAIYVGLGNLPALGAVVYAGNLYVARADGLWHVGDDFVARNVIDLTKEQADTNFESMVVFNGLLIFPVRDRVYQWNGARVADITPGALSDQFPFLSYQAVHELVQGGGVLYAIGLTNHQSPNPLWPQEHLLSWDGASWHKMFEITDGSSGSASVTALFFDAARSTNIFSDTLLIGREDNSVPEVKVDAWYPAYIGEFPYPDFPVTGTHSLITSRLDMGFRRVVKSVISMLVESSNISDEHYLDFYYSLDGANWVFWESVKTNGVVELFDPGGFRTVESHYMQVRVDFVTTDNVQTPILESMTLRFIVRPDVRWGYNFNVIAAPNMEHGRYASPVNASAVVRELRKVRDSKAPVEFIDILGDTYFGYISSMSEIPVERSGEGENGKPAIEYLLSINFVVM